MKTKPFKLYLYISIFLILTLITIPFYIHYTLKNKPYDELYLTVTQNAKFDNYPKLPKFTGCSGHYLISKKSLVPAFPPRFSQNLTLHFESLRNK